jgi:hypothetical protein
MIRVVFAGTSLGNSPTLTVIASEDAMNTVNGLFVNGASRARYGHVVLQANPSVDAFGSLYVGTGILLNISWGGTDPTSSLTLGPSTIDNHGIVFMNGAGILSINGTVILGATGANTFDIDNATVLGARSSRTAVQCHVDRRQLYRVGRRFSDQRGGSQHDPTGPFRRDDRIGQRPGDGRGGGDSYLRSRGCQAGQFRDHRSGPRDECARRCARARTGDNPSRPPRPQKVRRRRRRASPVPRDAACHTSSFACNANALYGRHKRDVTAIIRRCIGRPFDADAGPFVSRYAHGHSGKGCARASARGIAGAVVAGRLFVQFEVVAPRLRPAEHSGRIAGAQDWQATPFSLRLRDWIPRDISRVFGVTL